MKHIIFLCREVVFTQFLLVSFVERLQRVFIGGRSPCMVNKDPIIIDTFVPLSVTSLGGCCKGLWLRLRPVRWVRRHNWGGKETSWLPSSSSVLRDLQVWDDHQNARCGTITCLSFSMEGGKTLSWLFLKSSHFRFEQLENSESGRVDSLFPSKYRFYLCVGGGGGGRSQNQAKVGLGRAWLLLALLYR